MAFFEDNSITHNIENDAQFRAWASKIHKALEEVGLVNTTDTGQINLATVAHPAINTFAGYEIWRFNDAEQSERPIYLKIEYGAGTSIVRPALQMAVGRGSDGAGTLTNACAAKICKPTGVPGGNGYIHACLYKGSFHLFSCQNTATGGATEENAAIFYVIERVRNAATATFVNAVLFFGGASSGTFENAVEAFFEGAWIESTDSANVGGTLVQEASFTPGYKQVLHPVTTNAMRAILGSRIGVLAASDTGEVTVAGENLTYKRAPVEKKFKLVSGSTGGGGATREHSYLLLHQ